MRSIALDYVELDPDTKWAENNTIHAGSVKAGEFLSQLQFPHGICMAEDFEAISHKCRFPTGIFLDTFNYVDVLDTGFDRVMR